MTPEEFDSLIKRKAKQLEQYVTGREHQCHLRNYTAPGAEQSDKM